MNCNPARHRLVNPHRRTDAQRNQLAGESPLQPFDHQGPGGHL